MKTIEEYWDSLDGIFRTVQILALLDNTVRCISSLNDMKINTTTWNPILVLQVAQKLDSETFKSWKKKRIRRIAMSCLRERFLEAKFRTLELITPTTTTVTNT